MTRPAPTRDAIIALLTDYPRLTASDIAVHLGVHADSIRRCLRDGRGKYFRIRAWERAIGKGGKPVPIWVAGAGTSVPRPVIDRVAEKRKRGLATYYRYAALTNARRRAERGATVASPWAGLL